MKPLPITGATRGEGRLVRQAGSMHRFGHVVLTIEPNNDGTFQYCWEVAPERVPETYKHAVKLGVIGLFSNGAKYDGWSLDGTTVRVIDGSFHETDSNEVSFVLAAAEALSNAVTQLNL